MKFIFPFFITFISITATAQLTDSEIRNLKGGRVKKDTSYIYSLPYVKGKRYFLIQGANSGFSHKHELSFDFKMKKNSKICAAREGIVTDTRSDSKRGGLNEKYMNDGNYIIIEHNDGSRAWYWHLNTNGVLVKTGDHVREGQIIGLSGNTGYTAFPHLHFQVTDKDGKEILPRFLTKKGPRYIRPGRWHKSV